MLADYGVLCECSCFFFFQAEDGIRDLTVTGVQTCALPISATSLAEAGAAVTDRTELAGALLTRFAELESAWRKAGGDLAEAGLLAEYRQRSEERRVGKECRSRWSPYH